MSRKFQRRTLFTKPSNGGIWKSYALYSAGFLILLARPSNGLARVMTFVVLVGCNDTFGYIVGVLFGKHPKQPLQFVGFLGNEKDPLHDTACKCNCSRTGHSAEIV